jgi:hypothetical protein
MWYTDKEFWKKVFARALRSFFQGALYGIGENVLVQDFNWKIIAGASIGMFIISVCTSVLAGVPEYEDNNADNN